VPHLPGGARRVWRTGAWISRGVLGLLHLSASRCRARMGAICPRAASASLRGLAQWRVTAQWCAD